MIKPSWASNNSLSFLYRIVVFFTWVFFKFLYRHKVYGLNHVYKEAAIIAANHTSFYDPPILAISWPQEVHFLAKESLFKYALFGSLIRKLNSHPVQGDTSNIRAFKAIQELLASGKKVSLFPEGTRAYEDRLGELKSGVAFLVLRSQTAVIPAYIHGTFSIWNRERKLPKLWGKTACVFGSPISYEEFQGLDRKQAQKTLTERLAESIQNLRTWYEEGAKGEPP
ncbi:MAG: lysophospholipid acyltransferase family protein [Candidatus Rhabdochlamydia sp.]|jgi:1-acyl-sn-glycerol-3-phosphate acyltransferase|nr:1-acyl-sn-glycerol-3-phosphate acyltransferase [Chlamydiota bacterium]